VRAAVRAREKASMTRAAAWLEELGGGQYAQVFAKQSTAFAVISDRTQVNLHPFGHRKRMLNAIGALVGASRATDTNQATIVPPRLSAQRRQLTLPFCDVVGSTASGVHWRSAATCPPMLLARADEVIAMRRREFMTLLGGAAAWPFTASAQQRERVRRVGFLWESPAIYPDGIEGFRRGLRDLGWVEGQNIVVEHRWSEGQYDRLRDIAEELVQLNVDVIVAPSSVYAEAAKQATSTIPIVFAVHADPIGSGHVASLVRPGGNITGLSIMMTETNVKGLELLKKAVPGSRAFAVIFDPTTPSHGPGLNAVEVAGPALGLRIQPVPVRSASEFDNAFSAIVRERADAVLVLSTPQFITEAKRLAQFAMTHKLPTMFGPRAHAEVGGLMSYGPDRADLLRRAAIYVDKILKGAKPGDLPVQQPTKFELVINLKTAKALSLDIPPAMLALADEVIE
jgi:putative tryptophan/tyrosine transport system substrate-binding protein